MKEIYVKDLMVPLEEYATVSEDATLYEAVIALEKAQEAFGQSEYRHRAILVFDKKNRIVGKVSQLDLIRGLEKGYRNLGDLSAVSRTGFSPSFIKSLMENYGLWNAPIGKICANANKIKVKDFMYTPSEAEFAEDTTTLSEAMHKLVIGHHQSLIVTSRDRIVGILRLTDVFKFITQEIKKSRSAGKKNSGK